ncbi:hypothetical protein [Aquimarina agarilytica]|uniref:hypothetical protein n=1 Tax=Aquimarina agarilytica TaxID=1087449 RepID=UPI0002884726|nr:hypothetical protein [Aquimarina agarilytica]
MKIIRTIILIIILLGQNSCAKEHKKKATDPKIKGFEFIEDFSLNKSVFNEKLFEANNYSNYNGELKVFFSKEKNYIILDYILFGSDHNLYLTYWTNKDLKIKFSRSITQYLNKGNTHKDKDETYAEVTAVISSYLSYENSSIKLYDGQKNEILDASIVDIQKKQSETFFNDLIGDNIFSIHSMVNNN